MIRNKDQILALLQAENCAYQFFEHPPVFTVEEALKHCSDIPGSHVKNLFLRNKKKTAYWLITVKEDKRVDLQALGELLGGGRLSFGSADDLMTMLGVTPGSVTPLAMVNDHERRVKLFFDRDLLKDPGINIHPMENTATIHLELQDLLSFIEHSRQEKVEFLDLPI